MAHMDRATIKENLFEGNNGHGYWCDLSCDGVTIVNNITQSNTKSGIFYEVSTNGIIASNLLIDDAQGIRNSGPNTKIFNNTILSKGSGIYLQQDKRLGTSGFPAKYSNVIVSNNLTKTTIQIDPADKLPTSAYTLSGNISSINPSSYLVNATNYYRTGNFTVKSGTNAYRTVAMIPNDVISAVGIPNIPPFNKGALTWFVPPAFTNSLNSAPTVPLNLSMSAINDTSATITWSKSTDSENDQFTYTIKNGASV
jgi:parallel beta-helix repeat protein